MHPIIMDDKSKLIICRRHLIYFALSTRLAIVTIQFIANTLISDHNPDVFTSPKEKANSSVIGKITTTFLGGLLNWDGQYFYHIARYGYSYENTLAFFPLYPLLARIISIPLSYILSFVELDALILIILVSINVYFFVKSALALFDLTTIILNRKLAYRATFLFCINPASIFFVAPYTECIFSYFSFTAMLNCAENYYKNTKTKGYAGFTNLLSISVPISLSIFTRSNGILNIGFLLYYWLFFFRKSYWPHNIATLIHLLKCGVILGINILICFIPFIAFQIYAYQNFCTNFDYNAPKIIMQHAEANLFVLPGSYAKHNQSWCSNTIPLAYSYIQDHYWNVGFLRYYEFKQIPNFLLALPLAYIIIKKSICFPKQHCFNVQTTESAKESKDESISATYLYDEKMFVFVLHAAALTIFCILCIHVQVTTRMLCSASPVLYWFCAYAFENISSADVDLFSSWKGFLFTNKLNREQKFIKYYFLSYFVIGTTLFSNEFPWT